MDRFEIAEEWFAKFTRGMTTHEGHPVHTITEALKIAAKKDHEGSENE